MEEYIHICIHKGGRQKLNFFRGHVSYQGGGRPPRFAKKFFFRQNVKNAQHSPKTFFKSTGSREIFIKKGLRGGGGSELRGKNVP